MTGHRIPTSHIGSLPRPEYLLPLLQRRHDGESVDEAEFEAELERAIEEIVRRQLEIGIDIINDGEMGKIGYATYVSERLSGFGGAQREGHIARDLKEYKNLARRLVEMNTVLPDTNGASCIDEVKSGDLSPLHQDLRCFAKALENTESDAVTFMTSASPGVISVFQLNEYYPSERDYIEALAEAMRPEYEAIVKAGHLLQLDCPDLAMNRHLGFQNQSEEAFLERVDLYVEAINHATRDIEPRHMRMHLCWGNYQGPHHHDIALPKILPLIYRARPSTICLEGANPRHAHEWQVFETLPPPKEKRIAPGVLDTCTNYVEHPEWIAQRLEQYAQVIDPERLEADSDCGFSTFAGYPTVDPDIAWLKLGAMVDGAEVAAKRIFS